MYLYFQVQVQACDSSTPARCSDKTVTVNIIRQNFPPEFQNTPYVVTIDEKRQVGNKIFTIKAVDRDLKGEIVYDVIGLAPAPTFFGVDKSNGDITIKLDLKQDTTTPYTLKVVAFDSRETQLRATADVTIKVQRNANSPVFTKDPFRVSISENQGLGETIIHANATDKDNDTLRYELIGTPRALQFFYINPLTGAIALKKGVKDEGDSIFTINVRVTDGRYPNEKNTTGTVIVTILRDSIPVIEPSRGEVEISETQPINSTFFSVKARDSTLFVSRTSIIHWVLSIKCFFLLTNGYNQIEFTKVIIKDAHTSYIFQRFSFLDI